jgi:ribosome-binding ATPase YchF (GTP1/OBG family)
MVGIKSFLLPRPELSEQLPRLPITIVHIYRDLGIQNLFLASSVGDTPNTLNLYPIRRMEIISIAKVNVFAKVSKSTILPEATSMTSTMHCKAFRS